MHVKLPSSEQNVVNEGKSAIHATTRLDSSWLTHSGSYKEGQAASRDHCGCLRRSRQFREKSTAAAASLFVTPQPPPLSNSAQWQYSNAWSPNETDSSCGKSANQIAVQIQPTNDNATPKRKHFFSISIAFSEGRFFNSRKLKSEKENSPISTISKLGQFRMRRSPSVFQRAQL